MGHKHRQSMQPDFVRWCKLRARIAHASNHFEMATITNKANLIEAHWAYSPHAAKWFRLQGRNPQYIAHISHEASEIHWGVVTVETYSSTDIADALTWTLFRLQHSTDKTIRFSVHRTGFEKPIYRMDGTLNDVVDRVSAWRDGYEKRAA
ncbi:hypothetical protein ACLMAJ_28590 [Nocardia sp. KC 131]|uniref:hypothetical protein n=1 Tax=Nocardia arseniciresistens TaxID=3392119 RepID=UPI00398F84ED